MSAMTGPYGRLAKQQAILERETTELERTRSLHCTHSTIAAPVAGHRPKV